MEKLLQDVRFGFRQLLKKPGFAALAIISMALGIGANTSIFSLVDTVLLRPLAVKEPSQLVELYGTMHNGAGLVAAVVSQLQRLPRSQHRLLRAVAFIASSSAVSRSTTPATASGVISFREITSMSSA